MRGNEACSHGPLCPHQSEHHQREGIPGCLFFNEAREEILTPYPFTLTIINFLQVFYVPWLACASSCETHMSPIYHVIKIVISCFLRRKFKNKILLLVLLINLELYLIT